MQTVKLDDKTILKLAIAVATASQLADKESIGPLVRKVREAIADVDECIAIADRTTEQGSP